MELLSDAPVISDENQNQNLLDQKTFHLSGVSCYLMDR